MGSDHEDQTLTCVQCGAQFVFSADEQEFFESKGLESAPKRCKACRAERRKSRRGRGRGGRMKEYRGPAFRDGRGKKSEYRSPGFQQQQDVEGMYRGPAFQDSAANPEEIYTAPAFREREEVDEAVYTSPAFKSSDNDQMEQGILPGWRKSADDGEGAEGEGAEEEAEVAEAEHDLEMGPPPDYREPSTAEEMYRGPAFAGTDPAGYAPGYKPREMTEIVCAECGKKSRVPFKPKKDRPVYCKDCFNKKNAGGGSGGGGRGGRGRGRSRGRGRGPRQ